MAEKGLARGSCPIYRLGPGTSFREVADRGTATTICFSVPFRREWATLRRGVRVLLPIRGFRGILWGALRVVGYFVFSSNPVVGVQVGSGLWATIGPGPSQTRGVSFCRT